MSSDFSKANNELKYRFRIKEYLGILLIKDKEVYNLEEFPSVNLIDFAYNADTVLKGSPMPSYTSIFGKIYYEIIWTTKKGLLIFRNYSIPTLIKFLLLLLLVLSPLIIGAMFFYLAKDMKDEERYDDNVRPEIEKQKAKKGLKDRRLRERSMHKSIGGTSVGVGEEFVVGSSLEESKD